MALFWPFQTFVGDIYSHCKKNLPSSKLKKKEKEKKHIKKTTKEVDLIITQKQMKSELKVSSVSKG